MQPVREVVHRDVIEDLWSAGYTILPRNRHPDPFFVPPDLVPMGRAYQWWHLVHDKFYFERPEGAVPSGWAPVPASRHDGYFMPAGHVGNIEVNGLGLFEKPKFEVDQERDAGIAKAHQQVSDWAAKAGQFGLSGAVSVGGVDIDVGDPALSEKITSDRNVVSISKNKTIETRVNIPGEMVPHMAEIFAERDRLYSDLIEKWSSCDILESWQFTIVEKYHEGLISDPALLKGPALNALLLPHAIENVRKSLVTPYKPPEEKTNE